VLRNSFSGCWKKSAEGSERAGIWKRIRRIPEGNPRLIFTFIVTGGVRQKEIALGIGATVTKRDQMLEGYIIRPNTSSILSSLLAGWITKKHSTPTTTVAVTPAKRVDH
jgi:hypothetical protein